jgi:DNA-3-methyladenine glycosylase I
LGERCWESSDAAYNRYHDEEWGRPVVDETGLYERFCLEGFQSGLSWLTILRKRENFRAAFAAFDPDAVARFGARDVARLLGDVGIVRLRESGRPLPELVWSYRSERAAPRKPADWQASTPESIALSKELRKAGFGFVGPTTVYAAMQACGVVNDHLATCPARPEAEHARAAVKIPGQ